MDRKVVLILVGCVAVLIVGVLLIGTLSAGLDGSLQARAQAELMTFSEAATQFQTNRQEVENAIAGQPTLFAAEEDGESWISRLDDAAGLLKSADPSSEKLRALLEANSRDSRPAVETEIQTLATARSRALSEVTTLRDTARRLLEFQKQLSTKLPEMNTDLTRIQQFDLTRVRESVQRATADWPGKKVDLDRRLALYETSVATALERWEATEAMRSRAAAGQATGEDIVELIALATRLTETRESLADADEQMNALVDQLYWSWDKILVDMEIQEGELVGFRLKFQTVRNRVLILPEGEEEKAADAPMVKDAPVWQTVDKAQYEASKDHLGMSVQHKAAGKFDHEATSLVQPPGYAQMCTVQERRNHYGYWRPYGSGFHWFFYRPYYPMGRTYWGREHSPVTNTMYDRFDSQRRSGQTYFGRDSVGQPLYGSNGTATKRNYAASRYVSTGGFRNTQYVKSGGSYRGSRYARASRTTSRTSSYRSSSYSSGSRSSFGGK